MLDYISVVVHLRKDFDKHLLEGAISMFSLQQFMFIFDECIKLDGSCELSSFLMRTWMSHASDGSYVHDIYESAIVKPMTQTWYHAYISDESITNLLQSLSTIDVLSVLENAFYHELHDDSIDLLLKTCTNTKKYIVDIIQKMLTDDKDYFILTLKYLSSPTNGALHSSQMGYSSFRQCQELLTEVPQLVGPYTEGENAVIRRLNNPPKNLKPIRVVRTDGSIIVKPVVKLLAHLLQTLRNEVLPTDFCTNMINVVFSNDGKALCCRFGEILKIDSLHFKIPRETCHLITKSSISLKMVSLLRDLLNSPNVEITDEFVLYILICISHHSGNFAHDLLDCVIPVIEHKKFVHSDDVQCAILTLVCDSRYGLSKEGVLHRLMTILNSVKQISNGTLQVLLSKLVLNNRLTDFDTATMKTIFRRTHLPKILGHTAVLIVKYAMQSGMTDKKCLKFILRKSDVKDLGCSRLLNLLKLAIKHKRYAVIRALIFSGFIWPPGVR